MTPCGLGLVCGGKQEDALWVLWCAACQEAEEELGFCPSSSLTDTAKNNDGNLNIHCKKLPAWGFSSETELPRGSGDVMSSEESTWHCRATLGSLALTGFVPAFPAPGHSAVSSEAPLIVPGGTSKGRRWLDPAQAQQRIEGAPGRCGSVLEPRRLKISDFLC